MSEELDNADIIVSFWAIDNTLNRIKTVLDEIANMCNPDKE